MVGAMHTSIEPTQHNRQSALATRTLVAWMLVALVSHTSWGAYPVLARYLQTVSGLPSMSLLVVGMGCSLGLMLAWRALRRRPLPRFSRFLVVIAVVVAARSITNLLAARYTLAIYVQLITLMTPFVVTLLNRLAFDEPVPPATGRAMVLATLGAVLMLSGSIEQQGVIKPLTRQDWLGLGLAAFSTFTLALYMLIVRQSVAHNLSGEQVFLAQLVTVLAISAPASLLLHEDWTRWLALTTTDWLVFGAFAGLVIFGANVLQITALRRIGATTVSSMLPWRMVVVLVLAAFLLGERLTSIWQLVGAVLVTGTLMWYLWKQR